MHFGTLNKHIAIIGTVGVPAKYGGFETLIEHLTRLLAEEFELTVFCSSKSYSEKLQTYNGAKLKYIPLQANGIQSIPYDIFSILRALFFADTLLILGVSGCVVLPIVRLISQQKIIVNIDGLEWKREKWGRFAKWFLKFSEKIAVKNAHIVISDNEVIKDYVLKEYGVNSELIPYGADHCKRTVLSKEVQLKFPFVNGNYVFKVCRIEPENNVHVILEAFANIPEFNIVIVGNWNNSDYGRQLKLKFDSFGNINLLDPIYNQNQLNQIRSNCSIYVHGHSAGGTNPSLVEAMYLELPIIAFGVNYNIETTENKARYFKNIIELIDLIKNTKKDELVTIAQQMKKIANRKYTWKIISEQYYKLFTVS